MPLRAETRARALALQLLYAWDVAGPDHSGLTAWQSLARLAGARPGIEQRAHALAAAVLERRAVLDEHIARAAQHWRLERIGAVDRNVLRLAVLELLEALTPPRVVLDEAVRLARWFGGGKSPPFVNGVLDRVARDLGRL
jgi:N utilization substance protein B